MIDYEQFCKIKMLQEYKFSAVQISRTCHINEKTIRRYLKLDHFPARKTPRRSSKLDSFKERIVKMLEQYPYTAIQIFRKIKEDGYQGGYTMLKMYVRNVRPPRRPAYLTLKFAPAECAQVDWGSAGVLQIGDTRRRLSFFVMVLCYSRMLYVRFTLRETTEYWLQCHRDAFEFFGGVPARVMVDNCKTAVLSNRRGQPPVLNARYVHFANHYGFKISPCNVRAAHEKGRVENAVGYIKKSLLAGLKLDSLVTIQQAADQWRDKTANVRIHGVTGKPPIDMFDQEKASLQSLPKAPFDCSMHKSSVMSNSQFRVSIDGNKYSVPAPYASRHDLTAHIHVDTVRIFHENSLIAEHQRRYTRGGDYEHPDHPKPLLEHRRKARDQALMRRFLAIGPEAEVYYHGLTQRRLNVYHHIRKIVAMLDCYDLNLVRRVMADAAGFHAYSSECIINLLEQHSRHQSNVQSPLHLTRNQDLLNLEQPHPNLDIYSTNKNDNKEN